MTTAAFRLNTETYCGVGSSRQIGPFLASKGIRNVAILVDEGVRKQSAYYEEIYGDIADNASGLYELILRGSEEPDYDYLDDVACRIRSLSGVEALVGIGGGSCLDIMKGVAILATNAGRGIDYRGFDKVANPGIPAIAVPTTAGTGSEATINAVFTDKKEMKKLGINGRFMNATYAFLDAEWTLSCPRSVAVSAGMDALVHCLESFMCRQHTMMTRIYSREAFRILYENLPAIVDDPHNKEKRQQLLLGAYLAAVALFNSGSGISGAFSYPLGVHYKIPHGIGGGIFLPAVLAYNVGHGYADFHELLDMVEYRQDLDVEGKNIRFAEAVRSLSRKLGVPEDLGQWGLGIDHLEEIVGLVQPLQAAFDQNPLPFSAEKDARQILRKFLR